jgi:TPR repeat protein
MRIAAVIAAALVGFACLLGPVAAAEQGKPGKPSKSAAAAHQKAQQQAAQSALSLAAHRGEEEAQYQLGMALHEGRGMKADPREALLWFNLAGANGIAEAAVQSAKAYEAGLGTKRDTTEAARWWYRAGELGNEMARRRFVELVLSGGVRSAGGPAGVHWIEDVAAAGNTVAQLMLGQIYEQGLGVAPDLLKAERWYRQVAFLTATPEARFRLGRMLLGEPGFVERDQRGVVKEIARPGMVEGERWLVAAARQGHSGAQYLLGRAYLDGIELPMDPSAATSWLQAAASQSHPEALMTLADMAGSGLGFFGKDPLRAFVYYDIAAASGNRAADEPREQTLRGLTPRQMARARQLAQDVREARGL